MCVLLSGAPSNLIRDTVVRLSEWHPEVLRSCSYLRLRWHLTWRDPDASPGFYALDWGFVHEHAIPSERISIQYLPAADHEHTA